LDGSYPPYSTYDQSIVPIQRPGAFSVLGSGSEVAQIARMPQFQHGVIVQQKEVFDPVTGRVVSKDTKIAGGSKEQLVGAFQEGISVKEHARVEAELIRAVQIAQEAQDKAAALEAENLRLRALAANGGVYHTDYDNVRNENVELKQTNQVLSAQASHCHEEMLKSQAKLGESEGMVQLLTGQRDMYLRQVTTLQQYPAVQQIISLITARENADAAAAAAFGSGAFASQQQQQVVASSVGNKPASYAGTRPKLARADHTGLHHGTGNSNVRPVDIYGADDLDSARNFVGVNGAALQKARDFLNRQNART